MNDAEQPGEVEDTEPRSLDDLIGDVAKSRNIFDSISMQGIFDDKPVDITDEVENLRTEFSGILRLKDGEGYPDLSDLTLFVAFFDSVFAVFAGVVFLEIANSGFFF